MPSRLIDRVDCASSRAFGMWCVAAILLILHWTTPLFIAPSVSAGLLHDPAGPTASEPHREPCEAVRISPQGSTSEVSSYKKKLDLCRSGIKPMLALDTGCAPAFPIWRTDISPDFSDVPFATSFDAFRARAPPVANA